MLRSNVIAAHPLKILVVDDHHDGADTMAMLIRLGGHEAAVAYSGPVAILMAEKLQPDVILLDIMLPRMDGYKVAEKLRENTEVNKPVIIAVSGLTRPEDRQHALDSGCDFFLKKPLNCENLLAYLRGQTEALLTEAQNSATC